MTKDRTALMMGNLRAAVAVAMVVVAVGVAGGGV
jgi:hypothetical protein